MAIKNYTSDKPIDSIFAELQQTLATHGAKQISYDYGDDGKVQGVQFVIKVNDRYIPIKLPARVEKAQAVLKEQWEAGLISHKRGKENTYGYDQAYRVAWRNIWLFAKFEARPKSFHSVPLCAFDGCVHFVDHTPSVESA